MFFFNHHYTGHLILQPFLNNIFFILFLLAAREMTRGKFLNILQKNKKQWYHRRIRKNDEDSYYLFIIPLALKGRGVYSDRAVCLFIHLYVYPQFPFSTSLNLAYHWMEFNKTFIHSYHMMLFVRFLIWISIWITFKVS